MSETEGQGPLIQIDDDSGSIYAEVLARRHNRLTAELSTAKRYIYPVVVEGFLPRVEGFAIDRGLWHFELYPPQGNMPPIEGNILCVAEYDDDGNESTAIPSVSLLIPGRYFPHLEARGKFFNIQAHDNGRVDMQPELEPRNDDERRALIDSIVSVAEVVTTSNNGRINRSVGSVVNTRRKKK